MATLDPISPVRAAPHAGRRRYLVDLQFQLKYTALIVVFGGLIMGLFGGAVWHEVRANSELALGQQIAATLGAPGPAATAVGDFRQAIGETDRRMLWLIVGTSLVVMAGLGLCGILLSHRVAGPILVLGRYTRALGEGLFPTVRPLRRGDELRGHFAILGEAIERLRERERRDIEALEVAAAQLGGAAGPEARQAREVILAILHRKREALEAKPG